MVRLRSALAATALMGALAATPALAGDISHTFTCEGGALTSSAALSGDFGSWPVSPQLAQGVPDAGRAFAWYYAPTDTGITTLGSGYFTAPGVRSFTAPGPSLSATFLWREPDGTLRQRGFAAYCYPVSAAVPSFFGAPVSSSAPTMGREAPRAFSSHFAF
jgi:hypothetical protein